MKIIQPSWELIRPATQSEGVNQLRFIERMARISHRSEERQKLDTWERFISAIVLQHGDWSVVEHSIATVIFTVNRGITHELVRHRLFGFTQESTRFVNYGKGPFGSAETTASYIPSVEVAREDIDEWNSDLQIIDSIYLKWLKKQYAPQIARDFLPNALAARISVTGNFRNWRHALLMRTSKETHPDFKCVMIPLLLEFQKNVPLLFDDIVPDERQIDAMKKPR